MSLLHNGTRTLGANRLWCRDFPVTASACHCGPSVRAHVENRPGDALIADLTVAALVPVFPLVYLTRTCLEGPIF